MAVLTRRAVLAAPLASACAARPAPESVGVRVASAYLRRETFMMYEVGDVRAVHYADVACAYGVARLAAATGDDVLFAHAAQRHSRFLAEAIPNSENHVDANVYGVWPLELYRRTRDPADLERGLHMADGQWIDPRADGLSAQTRFWIDDVWMIGALQIQAWRATAEARYLDRAADTAAAYVARLQQPNGLFHHGPEAPFFWGRGNGWVAAGLAEILSELPRAHPRHAAVEQGFRRMMAALLAHQAEDGMWRQLIDYPEAWKESSGTAMFAFAMQIGAARGVLRERAYAQAAARAWATLGDYVEADGQVRAVCIGTGQSRDVDYYLNRPSITGDLHGQAPMLWLAAARAGAWG